MMVYFTISLLLVLFFFSLLMVYISRRTQEQKQIKTRMEYFSSVDASLQNSRQGSPLEQGGTFTERVHRFLNKVAVQIDSLKKNNDFDFKMQQAAWPILGTEFQLIILGLGCLIGAIVGILTLNIGSAATGFFITVVMCLLVLSLRIKRRQAAFAEQLGDMLTMIANALRAGLSFMQALEHIAGEMEDPVRYEVRRVIRDVSVGVSLEESLTNMVRRMESSDFNLVVAAVLIQRQVGGSLAQVLDTISDTINERIRMRREILALTSQGRMSGLILAALPFGLTALLLIIAPDYLNPLFNEPVGRIAIGAAIVSIFIGGFIIKKIVDIEM